MPAAHERTGDLTKNGQEFMHFYRIVFARNEIISCTEAIAIANDLPYYEEDNGQLIFALVKAENEAEARVIASTIVDKVKKAHKGGIGFK